MNRVLSFPLSAKPHEVMILYLAHLGMRPKEIAWLLNYRKPQPVWKVIATYRVQQKREQKSPSSESVSTTQVRVSA